MILRNGHRHLSGHWCVPDHGMRLEMWSLIELRERDLLRAARSLELHWSCSTPLVQTGSERNCGTDEHATWADKRQNGKSMSSRSCLHNNGVLAACGAEASKVLTVK